jgi:ubiquinone/menaquinone biosynthesis C-methylase UbiE
MRILDVGCGRGTPAWCDPHAEIIGIDINERSLSEASRRHPKRRFIKARAEALPFTDGSFDRVVCNVALPYMQIPVALREMYRVLSPSGELIAAVHPPRFTISEFNRCRRLKPLLFRAFVLANGLIFHLTGWSRWESFQTVAGMRKALHRAGFLSPTFREESDVRLVARAKREPRIETMMDRRGQDTRAARVS